MRSVPPETAVTDLVPGVTAAATAVGNTVVLASLAVQPDRPWIRVRGATDTGTDSFTATAYVLGLPVGL